MGWAYGVCITLCVLKMAEGSSHGGRKAICRPFNLWFCVLINELSLKISQLVVYTVSQLVN